MSNAQIFDISNYLLLISISMFFLLYAFEKLPVNFQKSIEENTNHKFMPSKIIIIFIAIVTISFNLFKAYQTLAN